MIRTSLYPTAKGRPTFLLPETVMREMLIYPMAYNLQMLQSCIMNVFVFHFTNEHAKFMDPRMMIIHYKI